MSEPERAPELGRRVDGPPIEPNLLQRIGVVLHGHLKLKQRPSYWTKFITESREYPSGITAFIKKRVLENLCIIIGSLRLSHFTQPSVSMTTETTYAAE